MLEISKLSTKINDTKILKGINLSVKPGEIHAIMGPNGSGKSTLASVIAGKDGHEVIDGNIKFLNEEIVGLSPEEIAHLGIFLSFQYPVEIPGVSLMTFMKACIDQRHEKLNMPAMPASEFIKKMKQACKSLNIDSNWLSRGVNNGFSGGEKKRNEIFQMLMLKPKLAILDETDSGLDVDALKIVSSGINMLRNKNNSFIIITHYERILNYVVPDFVHILSDGKIIHSGGADLAKKIETTGYSEIEK
tara:strand:+ start:476 stop:1216 length:741 start_codon:yes stop_codon:yes gene_type:complete